MVTKGHLRDLESAAAPSIAPTPLPDCTFPLSPAQRRMWLADRSSPGNAAYNNAFRWSVEGPLEVGILERAFNEIIRRHDILRASFSQVGSAPLHVIAGNESLRIAVADLRRLPPPDREREMDRLCQQEARGGFDLETGPLIRVGLIQMDRARHVLMLTMHHLVSDGWSVRVIVDELRKIYSSYREGRQSPLPELTVQYRDYVASQLQQHEQDEEAIGQLQYWTTRLRDYRRLEVATDFPRPPKRTINSAVLSFLLPRELTDTLARFSTDQGVTMFVTALGACMTLLARRTGEVDVAVGSAFAGRNRTEFENLAGLFVNRTVFRANADGDPPFAEFLQSVRDAVWEAMANQDVAFERVIEAISLRDDPDEPAIVINFNCYRAYGGSSDFQLAPNGPRVVPIPSKSQGALYDLNFFMVEREAGWSLSLEYNTDLYGESTARQIIDGLRDLLGQIASHPERRISEFVLPWDPSVDEKSRAAYDERGDDEDASAPHLYAMPATVIQQRFWLLAKLDPQNPAFNMRAAVRLSGHLSTEALRASLKLIIDRHEILRTTFREQGDELLQIISPTANVSLVTADLATIAESERESRLAELLQQEAQSSFDLAAGPLIRARLFILQDRDHVLVITLHHIIGDGWSQNVLQRELWLAYEALSEGREPEFEPLEIQYGDFAVWQRDWLATEEAKEHRDFWLNRLSPPLPVVDFPLDRSPANRAAKGALETLVLAEDLVLKLKSLCQAEGVTVFMLTLSCFAILLSRYAKQDDLVIGSPVSNRRPETEPLVGPFAGPIALRLDLSGNPTLREILQRASKVTMDALSHADYPFELLAKDLKVRSVSGRNPLFQFYFFYQAAFLQGRQLSTLTVTPLPSFSVGTTFELQLAVIERSDAVRANLEYNPDLFDPSTIKKVLEYYEYLLRLFSADPDCRVDELDQPVAQRIGPLPQTTAPVRAPLVLPRNEHEAALTQIWQEVLDLPTIGVNEDFFALGGNSLRAATFVSKLEKRFGTTINLATLLIAPTIEQLARRLFQPIDEPQTYIVPLREKGSRPPLFCLHSGNGHLLDYREMVSALPEDQPVYGVRAPDLDGFDYSLSVETLADKYLQEIRRVQPQGPYQVCGLSFGGLLAYEVASRLAAENEHVGLLALFDTGNPAHYRDLPPRKLAQFRRKYLIDRLAKYGRNIIHGRLADLQADARQFVTSRFKTLIWIASKTVFRMLDRPVPSRARSELVVFSTMGRAYTPRPYPAPIVLFRAEGRTAEYGDDMTLGWTDCATGGIDVHHIPGSHMTLMRQPNVSILVKRLNDYLADKPVTPE